MCQLWLWPSKIWEWLRVHPLDSWFCIFGSNYLQIVWYIKSPTHERVPFRECICKSNLFVKFNKVSLGTRLTQLALYYYFDASFWPFQGFPGGSVSEQSACNASGPVSPWVEKIPWRRKWQPLLYSCLGNPMDKGAWWATVHGVTKSQTQLSD